jgi:hypothetical protein
MTALPWWNQRYWKISHFHLLKVLVPSFKMPSYQVYPGHGYLCIVVVVYLIFDFTRYRDPGNVCLESDERSTKNRQSASLVSHSPHLTSVNTSTRLGPGKFSRWATTSYIRRTSNMWYWDDVAIAIYIIEECNPLKTFVKSLFCARYEDHIRVPQKFTSFHKGTSR